MPNLSITKEYRAHTIPTEQQLDAMVSSIESFFNTIKIDSDNLASSAVVAGAIQDGSITGSKLAIDIVDGTSIEIASSQMRIKALGVSTAKLATNGVTIAKREARAMSTSATAGQVGRSALSDASFASGSFLDPLEGPVSLILTTLGNPVVVGIFSDGASSGSHINSNPSTTGLQIKLLRDATTIGLWKARQTPGSVQTFTGIIQIDAPVAGTYTYQIQGATNGVLHSVRQFRIYAWEL